MKRTFLLLLLSFCALSSQASDLPLVNLAFANLPLNTEASENQFELNAPSLTKLTIGQPLNADELAPVQANESRDLLVESGFSFDNKTRLAVVLLQNTHSRELQGKLNFTAQF